MHAARAVDSVTLTYHLADLSTAQHQAGLAGLVLQVRDLRERAEEDDSIDPDELPVLENVTASAATLTLTERSTRRLFDELYTAKIEQVAVKSKWTGQTPVDIRKTEEIDSETGKSRTVTHYIYDVVTPRNPFLMRHLPSEPWQKLWRDMLYNIPRSKPTTRIPYNERAAESSCSEGAKAWKELQQFEKARGKNELRTTSVSGALLLCAQDVNAEGVPFQDQSDHALLLHFWPLTAAVFIPWVIKVDPAQPAASKEVDAGFALAIPEIADLDEFCVLYPRMLAEIAATRTQKKGYRPRDACIDLPEQSALELMRNFAALTSDTLREQRRNIYRCVRRIEYRHLIKAGNNVKSLGSGLVVADPDLLRRYQVIRDGYRNSVFRATLLKALLRSPPEAGSDRWFEPFDELFRTLPWELFLRCEQTPPLMKSFATDASNKFDEIARTHSSLLKAADAMSQTAPETPLESLILQMVRNFLRQKTDDKMPDHQKWNTFKNEREPIEGKPGKTRMSIPSEFRKEQERIATDVFLAIRSRRGQDFATYFTARICAVNQRHLSKGDDFRIVSQALLERPDDVKTLTLLALSACS